MRPTLIAVAGAALLVALAGCTGTFDVKQTEPLRIQLEGTPQTVNLQQGGAAQGVDVDTAGAKQVAVDVDVKASSPSPTTVVVKVEDKDTNEVLEQRNVTAQEQTVTQNIVVNVSGNHNIVVVTQAQGGDATVNIAAHGTAGTTVTTSAATGTASSTSMAQTTTGSGY